MAAALETVRVYRERNVVEFLWQQGERLRELVNRSIVENSLEGYFELLGRPCNLVFATNDQDGNRSQAFRTLFLQETVNRGVLIPYIAPSLSHDSRDIELTVQAAHEALATVRLALERDTVDGLLEGPAVKPVFRRFTATDVDA